ncbi:MAG: hypothetical protein AAGE86_09825 [Pseudomonadota bacterium]
MRIPTIIAATMLAVSPVSFLAAAQSEPASGATADAEAFEFRWKTFASISNEAQAQRLRDKAAAHCSDMADRGIEGYSSRRAFVGACARMIERETMAQLAERSRAKKKGARFARRPSSN